MAVTKKNAAILVPISSGLEPPFGYVRDFYTELAALPCTAALYDFSADFVTTDASGNILSVSDSLGKTPPLSLVPGATPAVFSTVSGGAGDFSVGTAEVAVAYQGEDYTGVTAYGICAVYSLGPGSASHIVASFAATITNTWISASAREFRIASPGAVVAPAYIDGRPEWGLGYRAEGASVVVTEGGRNTGTNPLGAPGRLYVGNRDATLDFGNSFGGLMHAVLVLTAVPNATQEGVIIDWAKSITPARV